MIRLGLKKVLALSCLGLALAACASHPSAPDGSVAQKAAPAEPPPPGCVGSTATLLPVQPGECAGFGNVYTKKQIDQTGQTTVNDALRLLDPALTVHSR